MVRTAVLCALVASMTIGSMAAPTPRVTLAADCPQASVAIGGHSSYEGSDQGGRIFTFIVAVTQAPGCAAVGSVQASTVSGSATAPGDYQATTTTLVWDGEATSRAVNVVVSADAAGEPDEQFTVALSNPNGLAITTAAGVGSVLDDDDPPFRTGLDGGKICWSTDRGVTAGEVCPIPVRAASPVRAPITVRFRTLAVAGKPIGYEPVSDGVVTIPAGSTTGVAEVRLLPGPKPQTERFVVELFAPSAGVLGLPRAEITIRAR